ncbi:uncharacterized protein LOC108475308 [Gossypium arboreum]|uniref:Protein kinase domain-containing protein n=1 Tax=Gossypium arboreum TaxID=29729 RepID=A0ABR0QNX5_GOSAR|nr:uncharacterized protein LOC108475308 [Gossypium arboreum]KAK5841031.1 hypothetical protein PVK06_009939 [Gossypium arboreum]
MASDSSLKSYHGKETVVSSGRSSTDGDTNNICVQTGEEFSTEFLRHTGALRRIAVTMDADHSQPRQAGFSNNQNCWQVYKDLKGSPESRRKESEYGSNVPNFVPGLGCIAEVDSYHDHFSRYNWQIGGFDGQKFVQHSDVSYIDQLTPRLNVSPVCVAESPQSGRSNSAGVTEGTFASKMKFLCSFGGRILPRPNDGKLRYVGGETRIISIKKNLTWEELARKTTAICNQPHTIKYQLPGEDLDALISVCSDEDLHHMIEEYHELERNGGYQRLRLFLVPLNEHERHNSLEGRSTPRQHDIDYQYVFAVNGMLDTSGQHLASQTNQFGNASDYSHSFHIDYPTSAHAFDHKDYTPSSPNTARMFSHPTAKFLPNLHIPSKSFNHSPPPSPVQGNQGNPTKSNLQFMVDTSCFDHSNEGINRFVMGTHPGGNSYYMDATGYHSNHPHFPLPLMNHQNNNQHLLESILSNKSREKHFHNRSPSGEFSHHRLHHQNMTGPDQTNLMERALSDSQLQGHDERYNSLLKGVLPQAQCNSPREKSLSLALYNDSSTLEMYTRRNFEVASHNSSITDKNVPSATPLTEDLASSADSLFSLPVIVAPNSADMMDLLPGYQSNTRKPELHITNQSTTRDGQCAMTELVSGQPVAHGSSKLQPVTPHNLVDQEPSISVSNLTTDNTSSRQAFLHGAEAANCPNHKSAEETDTLYLYERSNFEDMTSVQSQPSVNPYDCKVIESAVIIEDVTSNTPADIPSSSTVVPHIQHVTSGETQTARGSKEEKKSTRKDKKSGIKTADGSIIDAKKVEIEAGIHGLQIIKNADIEELQELGSGTFGTVYYAKWRGTEVAVKRIKEGCFSGRPSEQERLTNEFWREAQILSKLHHPNVVSFYGVVTDGPGGTMATVTEYMVNGSLRNALLKKDRALDRRRKVVLALDAAFGMEYLHSKNIVHFDLKCDNLLINLKDSQRPICKVGDFGLSRIKRNTLVSGGVRGTLPWMAPELLNGSSTRVSEKVDVFSFGIALWEILTGEEPYASMHCGAIIGGIVNNTLRPPIPERCDPEWRKLMEECWLFEPASRPSFTEITNRLRQMSAALQPKRRTPIR